MSIEIPQEYASADFGFSAVDEATFQANQKDAKDTPPSIDENDINRAILNALAPLEDKLDSLLTVKNAEENDDVVYAKAQAVDDVNAKLTAVEKIVMPLLVNLLKTAEKEYIYWPNREKAVKETADKILKLTRG